MIPFNRPTYFLLFFLCHELIVAAYYFEYFMGLLPCPLCMVSRYIVILIGLVGLAAFLHKPGGLAQKIYHLVIMLFTLVGGITSSRHLYLQSLPADQVPSCGPGLAHMLETLPFSEVLIRLFQGSGECAEVSWRLLGLTMPAWLLVFYVVVFLSALSLFFRTERDFKFTGR